MSKDEARRRWVASMRARFVAGLDAEFDYAAVDADEAWDGDAREREREQEDAWFDEEEARFVGEGEGEGGGSRKLLGETGVQDF